MSLRLSLMRIAHQPSRLAALSARTALRFLPRSTRNVRVILWGRSLLLPPGHHLPYIVGLNPLWSMPIIDCLRATSVPGKPLHVVDVGANIGDTVAIIESYMPGQCRFLCIEPNVEWTPFLHENSRGLPVEIISCFVGEGQQLTLKAGGPGTAGSQVSATGVQSKRLDDICSSKSVDFIKVDTDGFDYPILRSSESTLQRARPALYFEYDPAFWVEQGEDPVAVFKWLADRGYSDFCFFSNVGILHCRFSGAPTELIKSLIDVAAMRRGIDNLHWDVFASTADRCDVAIRLHQLRIERTKSKIEEWRDLRPAFWSDPVH